MSRKMEMTIIYFSCKNSEEMHNKNKAPLKLGET